MELQRRGYIHEGRTCNLSGNVFPAYVSYKGAVLEEFTSAFPLLRYISSSNEQVYREAKVYASARMAKSFG